MAWEWACLYRRVNGYDLVRYLGVQIDGAIACEQSMVSGKSPIGHLLHRSCSSSSAPINPRSLPKLLSSTRYSSLDLLYSKPLSPNAHPPLISSIKVVVVCFN
ncbi:unnamed protein product [Dovyalis caffra]|uniref:Uncharacterized protein n=1 Tax=Dovyalis caffra TaxID=77055 RepID=A0AAV1S4T7_9ROSI|nr:unnamed protein product [Dovyalis caffra]